MECRPANIRDVPQLLALLKQLFAIEKDFKFDAERHYKAFELILASDSAEIFVVTDGHRVIGMVSVQIMISTAVGGYSGMIEDFVVDQNCRNQNAGTKLINYLEAWARKNNILRLQLLADKDNINAHRFYYNKRFKRTNMFAMKKLI